MFIFSTSFILWLEKIQRQHHSIYAVAREREKVASSSCPIGWLKSIHYFDQRNVWNAQYNSMADVQWATCPAVMLDDDRHRCTWPERQPMRESTRLIAEWSRSFEVCSSSNEIRMLSVVPCRRNERSVTKQWNDSSRTDRPREWDRCSPMRDDGIERAPIDDVNDHNHRNISECRHTTNSCSVCLDSPDTNCSPWMYYKLKKKRMVCPFETIEFHRLLSMVRIIDTPSWIFSLSKLILS